MMFYGRRYITRTWDLPGDIRITETIENLINLEDIQKDIDNLREQKEKLRSELYALQVENESLKKEIKALKEENEKLKNQTGSKGKETVEIKTKQKSENQAQQQNASDDDIDFKF